jgi:hypothetical protein
MVFCSNPQIDNKEYKGSIPVQEHFMYIFSHTEGEIESSYNNNINKNILEIQTKMDYNALPILDGRRVLIYGQ